jgi:hypothetical protein
LFLFIFFLRDVQNPQEESTINLSACPQGRDYGTIMYFSIGSTFGECSRPTSFRKAHFQVLKFQARICIPITHLLAHTASKVMAMVALQTFLKN